MNERLNIPDKIAVGFKKSESRLSYVTWINSKGKIQKQTSWDRWRNAKIPSLELENKPTSGFTILSDITTKFYYHGGTHELCRVLDPRGFEFELDMRNLLFVLKHTTSNHLELTGDFVYSWSGSVLVLLPCESGEYKMSKALQENKRRYTVKDLIPGHSYRSIHSDRLIYIGQENIYQSIIISDGGSDHYTTAGTLGSIFYDPISSQAVIITSGLGKEIDYELPEDTWLSEKEIQEWIVKNYPNIPYLSNPGTVTSLGIKEFPTINSTYPYGAEEYMKFYLGPNAFTIDTGTMTIRHTASRSVFAISLCGPGNFIVFDVFRPIENYALATDNSKVKLCYKNSVIYSVSNQDPDYIEELKKTISDHINQNEIYIKGVYEIKMSDSGYFSVDCTFNADNKYTIDDLTGAVFTDCPFWNPTKRRAFFEFGLSYNPKTICGLVAYNENGEEISLFDYEADFLGSIDSVIKISL